MNYLNYSDYSNTNTNNRNTNNTNTNNEKKMPVRHNKTIKKSGSNPSTEISDLYNKIHQQVPSIEEGLSSFKPLDTEDSNNGIVTEAPSSVPVNNMAAKIQEYTDNYYKNTNQNTYNRQRQGQQGQQGQGQQGQGQQGQGQRQNDANNGLMTQDVLLTKLNYIIKLLEEQHDERTSFVVEELILYSFLGIFIIFIIDSFGKASKYIR